MAIVGYEYRKRVQGETDWDSIVDVGPVLTSVSAGLSPSTTYEYQVRGYDSEGNRTAWSNIATATTLGLVLPDLAFICTGGCGNVGNSGHWSGSSNASVDTDPDNARGDGTTSILIDSSGAVGSATPRLYNGGTPTQTSTRFYIKFDTLPNANALIYYVVVSPGFIGNLPYVGLGYHAASQELRLLTYGSFFGSYTFESAGVPAVTGQWYEVNMKSEVDQGDFDTTIELQVDEIDLGTLVKASGANYTSVPAFGDVNSRTQKYRLADIVITLNADDYPIGPGYVRRLISDADGVHNVLTAGDFIVGAAGANITNSTTDSHELIDDLPMDTGTPATDDYITQAGTTGGSGTQYVEHSYGSPDGFVPDVPPRGVDVVIGYHGNGATGATKLKLVDNATAVDTPDAMTNAGSTVAFLRASLGDPPSPASAWKLGGGGNGDFNNFKTRFGYSTVAGAALDGVVIEAEFPE